MEPHVCRLTALLGTEVQDPDQDTFLLYSQPLPPSQDLGFVDARASSVQVELGGRGVELHQSPTLLASSRAGGTTGAVLWRTGALVAPWLASDTPSPLTKLMLPPSPAILEIGCGISPCIALALQPHRPHPYVLSDQSYVHKLVARNLAAANESLPEPSRSRRQASKHQPRRRAPSSTSASSSASSSSICFRPLDWETDSVTSALAHPRRSFDALFACDCIYNEALVAPFVQTCIQVCRLRLGDSLPATDSHGDAQPCVCLVAQQLRSHDVFLAWLTAFHAAFHVWQLPPSLLCPELQPSAGFVIHVGILRDSYSSSP
ncbi:hypothetical protein CDD81_5950 [Ophiocordyceps australis]|uniref:Diaminohydroxyphosphoribosylamino-pyrimidine deaminase n=1 Tax=Ophiocordyceps australis TaxID=1399860 RepID=A0A2C5XM62_9HYPO|nr:hypothetical protein CDD81_5950 [Ophiocordyceps australis]